MAEDFSSWVGRTESVSDVLEPSRATALDSALGRTRQLALGAPLPLLYHWLYFWDVRPPVGLGPDGHPLRGGFLPPVSLPRRMWAGGRVDFRAPLVLGETVSRVSTITNVAAKNGRSGELIFVTVEHRLTGASGLAVIEQQDIVYRDSTAPGSIFAPTPSTATPHAAWHETLEPDPVLLFRYSALTMNGHRIHYDRAYAMGEESYPGLVLHGPLQATVLTDMAVRHVTEPITGFTFRGQSPAFDGTTLHICGDPTETGATLWTEQGGAKTMVATVICGTQA